MEKQKPIVVETMYAILINEELRQTFPSLALARKEVKTMGIGDDIKEVKIVKQTISHTLIDSYLPKVTKTLSVNELSWD